MKKGQAQQRRTAMRIIVLSVAFCLTATGMHGSRGPEAPAVEKRADIIRIDGMQAFGALQRPPVLFLHQKHTEALEKKKRDCTACHLIEKDRLVSKYMRLKDTAKLEVMDIYHINCIACHKATADAGEKSGPVVCGECHQDKPALVSAQQPVGMDKSLHYRHSRAQNEKCEKCHHQYNEVTKQLYYAKGKEGTCRYCHRDIAEENRISMQDASHLGCIDCHRKTLAKLDTAGPITCNGCHDGTQQKLVEKLEVVPRMQLNQPDAVLVRTAKAGMNNSNPAPRMKRVPFNHKAHENYNDTCRVCHHADLNACVQCHTLQGAQEGSQVRLEQAMHRFDVQMSCLGCHDLNQQDRRCAGCHSGISKTRQQDPAACQTCHMDGINPPAEKLQATDEKMLAATLLDSHKAVTDIYAEPEIPEDVEIKTLSSTYGPVRLPHRKIVQKLFDNIKDNQLVRYFHGDKGTLCQGCHHNSPPAKNPPACSTCHGQPFDERDKLKPGLMAAYHRQCMECHQQMGIEKPVATDCTACHQKKG